MKRKFCEIKLSFAILICKHTRQNCQALERVSGIILSLPFMCLMSRFVLLQHETNALANTQMESHFIFLFAVLIELTHF